jgi:hypothetical protein
MLFAMEWFAAPWHPLAYGVLLFVGALGLVACISPSYFSALARRSDRWVDTNSALQKRDARVDVDAFVLPFARPLGVAVVAAVAFLAWFVTRL